MGCAALSLVGESKYPSSQEKEQLQKTVSSAEFETSQLRRSIASLAGENAALREQQSTLEAQLAALREVVSSQLERRCSAPHEEKPPMVSTPTQTEVSHEAARAEMAHWHEQLSKMSEWLRTGARLLEEPSHGVHYQAHEQSGNPKLPLGLPKYSDS